MKGLIISMIFTVLASSALSQSVNIGREAQGSGQPGIGGFENATRWDNDIFHAPQYMPGYPTASILYPRIVDVECIRLPNGLNCKGYNWMPEMGRGEYLMVRPIIKESPKPVVIIKEIPGAYS
jgi:hypothetical protein